MATTGPWLDFEQIRHNIKNNTVDRLKQILAGLNEECGTHFSKSGKKQDIIDRIVNALDSWRAGNFEDKYMKAKAIVYQVRTSGTYTPFRAHHHAGQPTPATTSHSTYDPPKPMQYSSAIASGSGIPHFDPYAPPRRPTAGSVSGASGPKAPGIRFKDSPFFSIDQAVTAVVECPESTSATDRRQQNLSFTLNSDQMTKMKTPGSQYQLRLFCTSSIFYAGVNAFRSSTLPCPIEFPPTCEVRVNNTQITANLKGLKKKPGTAPPPDIGKYSRITGPNKVDMVYVNSQQPVQAKKYYMMVMLVEATTIDAIITDLKGQHLRSAQEVRQSMILAMIEDDDIVAGPQKMSLKCPLTFVRISTPCRSSKCVHPQCFDATSWFTMMEQTTTWLCPVCERVLDHKDLIIDGYFNEILQQTPESVEDVMVEADGQWHTTDNKYGSVEWKAAHPPAVKPPSHPKRPPVSSSSCPPVNGDSSSQVNGKAKMSNVEIMVLDDSEDDTDEDEGRVKRELSPSYASSANQSFDGTIPLSTQQSQSQSTSNVIDLTLSDSDDDEPAPTTAQGKRKATEAEMDNLPADHLWKKGRIDPSSRVLPAPRVPSGGSLNGATPALPITSHPPPSATRYPSSFATNTLPPPAPYPGFAARSHGSGSSSSIELPPLVNPAYASRPSQNARWTS